MDTMAATVGMSLDRFVRDHALPLTRFAFLVSGDRGRAEDLVQEAFLSMHRRFGSSLSVDDPVRYARRCIVNANISRLRRRHVVELLSDETPDAPWSDVDSFDRDDAELWAALEVLPARQRAVLVSRYYLGDSDREIALMLGCRESSVRSLAARAFKTLRPILRDGASTDGAPR